MDQNGILPVILNQALDTECLCPTLVLNFSSTNKTYIMKLIKCGTFWPTW
jgi:hypothetical protein